MRRLRRNPDFLYSDAAIQRMSGFGGGRPSLKAERERLEKESAGITRKTQLQLLREAGAIADRYDKAHGRRPRRTFVPSFIIGTPEHLKPREGEKYKSPFAHSFRVKGGEGTAAEYAKLFKKFPSRMTYAILPKPTQEQQDAAREHYRKRPWEKYSPDDYDPEEVHRRARAVGAALRKQSAGALARRALRLSAVAGRRLGSTRLLPAEHQASRHDWFEDYEWSPDGMTIAGRKKNPMKRKKSIRRASAAGRFEEMLAMRALRGNPAGRKKVKRTTPLQRARALRLGRASIIERVLTREQRRALNKAKFRAVRALKNARKKAMKRR